MDRVVSSQSIYPARLPTAVRWMVAGWEKVMAATGHGLSQNYTVAEEWYRKAADQGYVIAK